MLFDKAFPYVRQSARRQLAFLSWPGYTTRRTLERPQIISRLSSSSSTTAAAEPPILQHLDDDGILTITLNRPKQRNALNQELLKALHGTLSNAGASPVSNNKSDMNPVRVVILQSQGYVFSSGHDLKELIKLSNDQKAVTSLFDLCSDTMQLLQTIPQPTICAVEGLATAAGCQLVASCDMVIASSHATFQTPGVTIGLFCHTPAVPLVRCIGRKLAMDMLLTGRVITANEALSYGLVSRLAKDASKEAISIAKQLATEQSSATLKLGKEVFYQQESIGDIKKAYDIANPAMVKNMGLYDANHGIDSFLQKTKPKFEDR